ncbi:acylphosphatase [Butyrivibrio sp. Su6]|uniref:acylphosphatase n=1 Tax=Butyrivibrio sp. Su6 TaxID=1520810 RepID=UPI00089F70D5|nr:acylphosphatase [Butyrivibrio sp. Su6]SEG08918.1 acylphosphatase [Butyrivibrio sp. Su6]
MSEIIRVHLNFKGYVQGVGFRYTAYHTAIMYGLTGWVKNEWNGSVTVEAQGNPAAIDMFIQKVKDGRFIEVLDMTKATIPLEDESSFQIRY